MKTNMAMTMWIIFLVFLSTCHFQQIGAQTTVQGTENGNVILPCVLSGGSFTLPEWRGPPGLIVYTIQDAVSETINPAAPASSRLKFATNKIDLIMSDVQLNDSGVYKCSYTTFGDYTVTLDVTAETTTTSTSINATTTATTTPTTTTTTTPSTTPPTTPTPTTTTKTKPTTTPSASPLSNEMIIVIVIVPVGVIAIVGTVILFYCGQMTKRKPARHVSDKRHKREKHYKSNFRPVQQHQQQPYILYGRGHTGESTNKDSKRSRSLHNDDRYNWYDGSQVKQNPVYKGDRNLDRLYYNETLPRYDDYRSGYTTGHDYPSHTRGYHYRPDYHGDSRRHGNRQYSSYPVYSTQQEYINPSYSYMGY